MHVQAWQFVEPREPPAAAASLSDACRPTNFDYFSRHAMPSRSRRSVRAALRRRRYARRCHPPTRQASYDAQNRRAADAPRGCTQPAIPRSRLHAFHAAGSTPAIRYAIDAQRV